MLSEANLALHMGIDEGKYRLLPIRIAPFDDRQLPLRIKQLVMLDLNHPYRAEQEWARLVRALRGPIPRRGQ